MAGGEGAVVVGRWEVVAGEKIRKWQIKGIHGQGKWWKQWEVGGGRTAVTVVRWGKWQQMAGLGGGKQQWVGAQ